MTSFAIPILYCISWRNLSKRWILDGRGWCDGAGLFCLFVCLFVCFCTESFLLSRGRDKKQSQMESGRNGWAMRRLFAFAAPKETASRATEQFARGRAAKRRRRRWRRRRRRRRRTKKRRSGRGQLIESGRARETNLSIAPSSSVVTPAATANERHLPAAAFRLAPDRRRPTSIDDGPPPLASQCQHAERKWLGARQSPLVSRSVPVDQWNQLLETMEGFSFGSIKVDGVRLG